MTMAYDEFLGFEDYDGNPIDRFICLECGHVWEGRQDDNGDAFCPICYSYDTEPATECDNCDTTISLSQARYGLCPDCEMAVDLKFRKLIRDNFNSAEIQYLQMQQALDAFGGDEKE